jgi:hypothetical protein
MRTSLNILMVGCAFLFMVCFQANRKERTNGYQARQIFLEQFNLWLRRQYREGFGVYT